MLKAKVDAGAAAPITQFFFENKPSFRLSRPGAQKRHRYPDRALHLAGPKLHADQELRGPHRALRCSSGWRTASTASITIRTTRKLIAAAVAAEQVLDLADQGVTDFHFYTMANRAELAAIWSPWDCVLAIVSRRVSQLSSEIELHATATVRSDGETTLRGLAAERILVLDGAMGTMIQALGLDERGYRGARFDGLEPRGAR